MKKRDFILIGIVLAIVLIISVILGIWYFSDDEEGAYVIVRVNGEDVDEYSLNKDGEYKLNGGTNILRIEDGKAYLIEANCPDHLCVKQGKIHQNNQTITCLPNRLTITVYGAGEGADLPLG